MSNWRPLPPRALRSDEYFGRNAVGCRIFSGGHHLVFLLGGFPPHHGFVEKVLDLLVAGAVLAIGDRLDVAKELLREGDGEADFVRCTRVVLLVHC